MKTCMGMLAAEGSHSPHLLAMVKKVKSLRKTLDSQKNNTVKCTPTHAARIVELDAVDQKAH